MKLIDQVGEALVLSSNYFEDSRGVFLKAYNTDLEALQAYHIRQVNYVVTQEQNTLRGLHYQRGEHAESKMFRILKGAVRLAFVDVRPESDTYLQAFTRLLNSPREAVLIPRGFATGYCTLTEGVVMLYTADNDYHPESEAGLLWNDPALNIDWQVINPVLSEKDKAWAPVAASNSAS